MVAPLHAMNDRLIVADPSVTSRPIVRECPGMMTCWVQPLVDRWHSFEAVSVPLR
jgi:hypothetical protein